LPTIRNIGTQNPLVMIGEMTRPFSAVRSDADGPQQTSANRSTTCT
jgi:hypothetical protein